MIYSAPIIQLICLWKVTENRILTKKKFVNNQYRVSSLKSQALADGCCIIFRPVVVAHCVHPSIHRHLHTPVAGPSTHQLHLGRRWK